RPARCGAAPAGRPSRPLAQPRRVPVAGGPPSGAKGAFACPMHLAVLGVSTAGSEAHYRRTTMAMETVAQTARGPRAEHSEGVVARTIEQQTAKLPSDLFLWAAGASIVGSLALQGMGRQHASLFVGQWAPTFLILGLYNKLVKVHGSDPGPAARGF